MNKLTFRYDLTFYQQQDLSPFISLLSILHPMPEVCDEIDVPLRQGPMKEITRNHGFSFAFLISQS